MIKHGILILLTVAGFSSVTASFAAPVATPTGPVASKVTPSTVLASNQTAPPSQSNTDEKRVWNLQDADIGTVIDEVSQETGKNFIVDPRVSGRMTIVSTKAMGSKELYQVFLSGLAVQGYSVVQAGPNTWKVEPSQQAQTESTVTKVQRLGQDEKVVVRVVPIQNVSAQQLVPILRPLLPTWAMISAYAPTNVLILSGNEEDVDSVLNIVHKVDVANYANYEMIHLKNATAKDTVETLNNLLNATRMNGQPQLVSLAADNRTNSVIVSGDLTQRMRVRILVSELDTKNQDSQNSNVSVIYLHYLKAAQFAPILARVAEANMALASGKSMPVMGDAAPAPASNAPAPGMSAGDDGSTSDATNTTPPVESQADASASSSPMIQPEIDSNALIITAPQALMQTLKAIIAQLDVRPSQVMVEAAIVELSTSDLKKLGVQFGSVPSQVTSNSGGDPQVTDFQNFVGIIQHGSWRLVLSALESNQDANVLSTPSVMVLNNHQASIDVGQQRSVDSGSYASAAGSPGDINPYTTTKRQGFTLSLSVTPQVTNELVQMAIDQTDTRLLNPDSTSTTPASNQNEIKTNVIVNSGDILVLGGLVDNNANDAVEKLPILGDIPLLGRLFQYKVDNHEKKNMMVFLHPVIVHSEADARRVTNQRYNFVRNLQLQWNQEKSLNEKPLPAWHQASQLPQPFGGRSDREK